MDLGINSVHKSFHTFSAISYKMKSNFKTYNDLKTRHFSPILKILSFPLRGIQTPKPPSNLPLLKTFLDPLYVKSSNLLCCLLRLDVTHLYGSIANVFTL